MLERFVFFILVWFVGLFLTVPFVTVGDLDPDKEDRGVFICMGISTVIAIIFTYLKY